MGSTESIQSATESKKDPQSAPQVNRPNILLINIDDLGWKDLGFMGSDYYETPNIDQLASEGMVFSNAYASASNCAPSRAGLFSGQYSPRTGVYTVNNSDRGQSKHRKLIPIPNTKYIDGETLTIAELLRDHGYRTAHAGKWHISKDPREQGFYVNIGGNSGGNPRSNGMGGYFSPYNNPYLEDGPEGEYLTDRITTEAIDFLKKVKGRPFFLNYSPYIVHGPIQPKKELKEKYEQKQPSHGHDNPGYAAMVETMDHNVGRLISYLKESGRYENTLIIFTSDNGGVYKTTKQWPLRAGKGSYFEGGIRVPMIAVWPKVITSGHSTDVPINNIDFFPTFLEAAGIEKPEGKILDGVSLMPVFRGEKLANRPLYWHFPIYLQRGNKETHDQHFRTRPGSVIIQYPWKLHEYFEDDRLELYNLETDIQERENLVDQFPEKAEALHDQLLEWRNKTDAPVPTRENPGYQGD